MGKSLADLGEISKAEEKKNKRGAALFGGGLGLTGAGVGTVVSSTRAGNKALAAKPIQRSAFDMSKPNYYDYARQYMKQHGERLPGLRRSIAGNALLAGGGLLGIGGTLLAVKDAQKKKKGAR